MKSPITCSNPRCDEQIGWHHTYAWGPNGCDPPENIFYNEDFTDGDGNVYCSEDCLLKVAAHEEIEEGEEE